MNFHKKKYNIHSDIITNLLLIPPFGIPVSVGDLSAVQTVHDYIRHSVQLKI